MVEKLIYNAAEAAVAMGYSSTQTIYTLIHKGKIKGWKIKGHQAWRIPRKSIEDYIERCTCKSIYGGG